jgi:hypothetical protein
MKLANPPAPNGPGDKRVLRIAATSPNRNVCDVESPRVRDKRELRGEEYIRSNFGGIRKQPGSGGVAASRIVVATGRGG